MKKIFIGIDFSKEKFDATLIQAEGLKECAPSEHEVFDNKTSGYRRLVKWVKAHRITGRFLDPLFYAATERTPSAVQSRDAGRHVRACR